MGGPYCRGGICRKNTLRFLLAVSWLIREALRQLALCAHEGPKGPSALRAQGSGPRCQLPTPDGNSAIVFATDPTPAVLLPIPHCRKSISGFLIQRDLEIFCCGNLLPFITDLTPAVLLSHPVLKKIHQRLSYLVELRDFFAMVSFCLL